MDRPFEQISVAEIAREAGVSVGGVYRRFASKDALIPVLFELYKTRLGEFEREIIARAEAEPPAGLHATLQQAMRTAWSQVEAHGHLLRAVYLYARIRPDLVGEGWDDLVERSRASVRALLSEFSDEITLKDQEAGVEALTYFLNTILIEQGLFADIGPRLGEVLAGERLAAEMADFAYGYLTMPR